MNPSAAGLMGGGSLIGGILGARAAENAAQTQADAARYAADMEYQAMLNALRRQGKGISMQKPYMRMGNEALNTLAMLYGLKPTAPTAMGYSRMPDYAWMKQDPLYALAKGTPVAETGLTPEQQVAQRYLPGGDRITAGPMAVGNEKGLTAEEILSVRKDLTPAQAKEAAQLYEKYGDRALAGLVKFGAVGDEDKLGRRFEQVGDFAIARKTVPTEYGVAKGFENGAQGAFFMSPDYQAALDLGNQAMARQAAATGDIASGRQLAAAQDYGQKIGSSAYSDWYNRLAGIAQLGPQSAGNVGASLGTTPGLGNFSQLLTQGAGATAAGQLGASNAWANALNQGVGAFGAYQQGKADDAFNQQLLAMLQGGGGMGGGFGGGMGGFGGGGTGFGAGLPAFDYQPSFVTQ